MKAIGHTLTTLAVIIIAANTSTTNVARRTKKSHTVCKTIKNNLYGLGKDRITQSIREKQIEHKNRSLHKKVA